MSLETGVTALAQAVAADIKSLITTKANLVATPTVLTGNTTITVAMSGSTLVWNGSTDITLTFPAELPAGFACRVCPASTGRISFVFTGRLQFGNAFRSKTLFPWDVVDVELIVSDSNQVGVLIYNEPLPTLYTAGSSDLTLTTSTMVSIPGLAIVLEPFGAYDIDLRCMYTPAVISTAALKLGFVNLTGGAVLEADYFIATTNVSGTAPWRTGFLYGSTSLVTGSANAAVLAKLHAKVTGRIITGSAAVTLTAQAGLSAASTTNTITITGAETTLTCRKVYGT